MGAKVVGWCSAHPLWDVVAARVIAELEYVTWVWRLSVRVEHSGVVFIELDSCAAKDRIRLVFFAHCHCPHCPTFAPQDRIGT